MINLKQLRDLVVVPALTAIGHAEPAAVRLVIGTGLIESQYEWLAQNGGPALGFWQMETVTAQDIWTTYLPGQPIQLRTSLSQLMSVYNDKISQLTYNLQYAAAMCRLKYLRSPLTLPAADDLEGLANYWKIIYNSKLGAGDPNKFMQLANQYGLMNI